MKRFFSLLFIPQDKNYHRAEILKPSYLAFLLAFYLFNQLLIRSYTIVRPGVLGYSSEITIQKVIDQTNEQRQKNNLSPLVFNQFLSQSAQAKAEDMFKNDYWSHNSPQGKTPWDFFKSVNYKYSIAGENLAKDFYDTESMMTAWMNSPTHKDNIVNPKYQEIGIAVVNGTLEGVKTTLVVQHFGTPLAADRVVSDTNSNQPLQAVEPSRVEGIKTNNLISPLSVSKLIGSLIFALVIVALFIDGYVSFKNRTHRLTGSSFGHIGFLLIILTFMLLTRQGTIF